MEVKREVKNDSRVLQSRVPCRFDKSTIYLIAKGNKSTLNKKHINNYLSWNDFCKVKCCKFAFE